MRSIFHILKDEYVKEEPIAKAGMFLKFALILVIIFVLIISAASLMDYSEILKQTGNVDREIAEIQDRVDELNYLMEIPKNDRSFIIRMAREKLGLVLPEEIVYYSEKAE